MTKIFVNTDEVMTPGEIHTGEVWKENNRPSLMAIKCIREATKEEYLEFVKSKNLMHMVHRTIDDKKFYLVEILD